MRRTLTALLTASALALVACGDDADDDETASTTETQATQAAAAPPATSPGTGCTGVEAPEPKGEQDLEVPDTELDPDQRHSIAFETNCGAFTIALDVERAPETSSSIAGLVEDGFYDDLTFHRIVPGFVIQGGDPVGNGSGGPGYSVVEAPPEDLEYTEGVVAMAKTEIEDSGTSGSQFFVVTGEDAQLEPDFALLGRVTSGMDVVQRISNVAQDPSTGMPESPVVIESATLSSR